MGAQPAYSSYPERIPARYPERLPRTRVKVVPGSRPHRNAATLPSSVLFLAKAFVVVLVVATLVSFVRITLSAATVSTSQQSSQISSEISKARSDGAELEVSQSTLSNPTRIKQQAAKLGMSAPDSIGSIVLPQDIVTTDSSGALSLSQSVARASGITAH